MLESVEGWLYCIDVLAPSRLVIFSRWGVVYHFEKSHFHFDVMQMSD